MSDYAELAVTTNFSFLHGASHAEELVAQAKTLGLNNMIKKPFTSDAMRKCIESVVGRL